MKRKPEIKRRVPSKRVSIAVSLTSLTLSTCSSLAYSQGGGGKALEDAGVDRAPFVIAEPDEAKSFDVPRSGVVNRQLSVTQKRLAAVNGKVRVSEQGRLGHRITVDGADLAEASDETAQVEGFRAKSLSSDDIEALINVNRGILNVSQDAVYELDTDLSPETLDPEKPAKIYFRQMVGSVPVQHSYAFFANGKVTRITLFEVDPNAQEFKKESWLSEQDLISIAHAAAIDQYPNVVADTDKANGRFEIKYISTLRDYRPTYEHWIGSTKYVIDALNGEMLYSEEHSAEASVDKECEKKATVTAAPAGNHNCSTAPGPSRYDTFRVAGACVGSIPDSRCDSSSPYSQIASEFGSTVSELESAWSTLPSSGTNTYDLLFDYIKKGGDDPAVNGLLFRYSESGSARYGAGFMQPMVDGTFSGADDVRKFVSAHEAGHYWHFRKWPSTFPFRSDDGKALLEGIADIAAAFTNNDFVGHARPGYADLIMDPPSSPTWDSGGTIFDKEEVFAAFFVDILQLSSINSSVANKIVNYVATQIDNTLVGDQNIQMAEFQDVMDRCVNSACALNSTQQNQVCQLFASAQFPNGSICPPPPVPAKVPWIAQWPYGQCGFGIGPFGTVYGSRHLLYWGDVQHETVYNIYTSTSPFSGYSLIASNFSNDVQIDVIAGASPTTFFAVEGCNSSGCGDLTGIGINNDCD